MALVCCKELSAIRVSGGWISWGKNPSVAEMEARVVLFRSLSPTHSAITILATLRVQKGTKSTAALAQSGP
jgi:hypothetical protein